MGTLVRPPRLSADEFERLPGTEGFELIDGRLREKPVGAEASEIQSELTYMLQIWNHARRLGKVYESECGYRCFPNKPDRVRKPDVSFVRSDRLPGGRSPAGFIAVAPDFVAEVISPTDTVYELNEKLADYERAAIPLVWVLYPDRRVVQVRQHGQPPREFGEAEELCGDPVLPGFRARVAELFPPPVNPGETDDSREPPARD